MPSANTRSCPACGTVMPVSFPAGLCPKCLLAAAAVPAVDADQTLPVAGPVSGARPGGVPSVELLRGLFPDLEILDVLGAGGMGAVYKARQPRLNRLVALKIMVCPPGHEVDFALRFEREAQVLARLSHPHIVVIYDFGDLSPERTGADPLFYFLMEFVDGTDLGQLIHSKELKPAQALTIVPQICEALQYAHDQGITHRDIKPANILIDQRGVVKIADFGLAKMVSGAEEAMMTGLTQTGTAMGTPHYMAPEQWEHPELVDHRADIYALGVVFYEMLTGERPAGVFEPPSKKSKPPVDKKLDKVVLRAMEKEPDRRYQQAGQIGEEVTRISGAHKSRPATANGAPEARRDPLKPLLALGAVALLGLGGWKLWPGGAGSLQPAATPPSPALGGPSALAEASAPVAAPDAFPAGQSTKVLTTQTEAQKLAGVGTTAAPPRTIGRLRGAGVHENGKPVDMTNAEGITDFVQVILTSMSWVGLRANGEQVTPEGGWKSGQKVARLLPGFSNSYGILDQEGRLSIQRVATEGVKAIPEEVQRIGVVDAHWNDGGAIALLKDGTARVWGEVYQGAHKGMPVWPQPPAEALRDVIDIAAPRAMTATLTADGRLHCWGGDKETGHYVVQVPAGNARLEEIETRWNWLWVRDAAGLTYQMLPRNRKLGTAVERDILDIAGITALPRKGTAWTWFDPLRANAQAEVDALLKQVGRRPSAAFTLKVAGPDEASKAAAIWIEPVAEAAAPEETAARTWVSAFPDLAKLPGLVESKDGWVLSSHLTVPVPAASGGEMKLLNAGIRARMRFSEGAGHEAAQLILRRGSRGGDHFELRYYRNLSGDRPNQFQIRHWDHKLKRSTMLAGVEVAEAVHEAAEGFVLELYAIGSRLHGRLNGAYPISAAVPDAAFVKPGEAGFAMLKACWLTDMEVLNLDGVEEAEALKLAGLGGDEARESGRGVDTAAVWENLLDDPELKSSQEPAAQPLVALTLTALIHSGSRYTLIQEKLPWPDARRRAEELGRKLVVFETEAEEQAVRAHFRDSLGTGCWIGGYAEEGSPDIRWLSGTSVGNVSWAVGHPSWRSNKDSGGSVTEGLLWAAGLALTGQSVQIQPQKGARIGFLCEQPADAAGK